jgi:hypothetical protein
MNRRDEQEWDTKTGREERNDEGNYKHNCLLVLVIPFMCCLNDRYIPFLSAQKSGFLKHSVIFRGAHCSDMYPSSANDHPELTEARNKIHNLLDSFIKASEKGI